MLYHCKQKITKNNPHRSSADPRKVKAFCSSVPDCNLLGPLQESFGPFGSEIPKTSKKRFPGLSAPGSKNVEKKAQKRWKMSKDGCFWLIFDLYLTFCQVFFDRRRPGNPFFRHFLSFGRTRRARMTPVRGQGDANQYPKNGIRRGTRRGTGTLSHPPPPPFRLPKRRCIMHVKKKRRHPTKISIRNFFQGI